MYLEGNVNSNTGGSGGFVLAGGSANGGNCGQDFGGTAGRALYRDNHERDPFGSAGR